MIYELLGKQSVDVVYTIFGCLRNELTLFPDGTIRCTSGGTPGSEHRWARDQDGVSIHFDGPHGICAAFSDGDNPTELRGCWNLGDTPPAKIALARFCRPSISPDQVCIVIGSYQHPDWAIANARASLHLNPGVPVLVADDSSSQENQNRLRMAAVEYGFKYQVSESNNGHYDGDAKSLWSALAFAEKCRAAVAIRCNQRTIQLKPNWAIDVASTMLSDDSGVAYQCQWGRPAEIRTELLALNVSRWLRASDFLNHGRIPGKPRNTEWLYENWFHDLAWALFPWSHTAISWFSRNRWQETEWTCSHYCGIDGKQAMAAVENLFGITEGVG